MGRDITKNYIKKNREYIKNDQIIFLNSEEEIKIFS